MKPANIIKVLAPVIIVAFLLIANIIERVKSKPATASLMQGDEYATRFVSDVAHAKKSITCAMYIFKLDGYIRNDLQEPIPLIGAALIDAAKRKVEVSIIFDMPNDSKSNKYNKDTAKYLEKNGIKVYFDKPEQMLHTKMCVIDDDIVYIGSHNFTYSAMKRNSEVSARIISEGLANDAKEYLHTLQ